MPMDGLKKIVIVFLVFSLITAAVNAFGGHAPFAGF